MTVKIRLSRAGRKKMPFYHVVVADERMPRDGRYIERIGYFNPFAKGDQPRLKWEAERITHWLNVGACPSTRVSKLILEEKLGTDKQRAKFERKLNESKDAIQARIAKETAAKEAEAKAEADAAAAEAAAAEPAPESADEEKAAE